MVVEQEGQGLSHWVEKWGGGGNVRIDEVHGNLPGGTEVGAVIKNKNQVGFQGLVV